MIRLIVDGGKEILLNEKSKIFYTDTTLNITGEAYETNDETGQSTDRAAGQSMAISAPQSRYATLSIPDGNFYSTTLPDGTEVWLNAGSSLKYPMKFTDGERQVELCGEACFDVTKDPTRPFVIRTPDGLRTRVLGTRFNISSYADSPYTITMVTGIVEVDTPNEKHHLSASQQMVYHEGNITLRQVDPAPYVSWTSGRLGFDGDTLREMCRKMMRWYNVNIEIEGDGLDSVRFSGYIPREMGITEAFDLLYQSEKIKYRHEGNRYRLYR